MKPSPRLPRGATKSRILKTTASTVPNTRYENRVSRTGPTTTQAPNLLQSYTTAKAVHKSLANLIRPADGTCRYCGQKAGVLTRDHPDCRRTYDIGFQEMVNPAAETARTHSFDEKALRLSLAEIARPAPTGTAPRSTRPLRRAGNGARPTPWPTAS